MTSLPACQALRDRLVKNEKVKTGELRAALSDDHWADYCYGRHIARSMRTQGKAARDALADYFRLLRIADLKWGQSEKLSTTKSSRGLKRLFAGRPAKLTADGAERLRSGESYYERALERLDEIISQDRTLTMYLDRTWDLGAEGSMIGPEHEGVPRLSRSFIPPSVADSMLEIVEKAIADVKVEPLASEIDTKPPSVSHMKKLTKLMRR